MLWVTVLLTSRGNEGEPVQAKQEQPMRGGGEPREMDALETSEESV